MKKAPTSTGEWFLEFNEQDEVFTDVTALFFQLEKLIETNDSGRIQVGEDTGSHGWFSRFVLGSPPRITQIHFALEWSGHIGSLIFVDDADSEYRAADSEHPVHVDEAVRKKISHGDTKPQPIDECLRVDRIINAVNEFMKTRTRPKWLKYRYVS